MQSSSIYHFEQAKDLDVELIGGKGKGLVMMSQLGLPVPPGMIITTTEGTNYLKYQRFSDTLKQEIQENLRILSQKTNKQFGTGSSPLLLSVRSGAPISMPGQMISVLNVGITPQLLEESQNEIFTRLYWRFVRSLGVGMGIHRDEFKKVEQQYITRNNLREIQALNKSELIPLIQEISELITTITGKQIPTNPFDQLLASIQAVWNSWNTSEMQSYRNLLGIRKDVCTAVVIQSMVLGNADNLSGTGVIYSRNLIDGKKPSGTFLRTAQGEAIVSGEESGSNLSSLAKSLPATYQSLLQTTSKLEKCYKYPVEVEFTIERKKLWILQVRKAPVSDQAVIEFVVDLQAKDIISEKEAVEIIRPSLIQRLYAPVFSKDAKEIAYKKRLLISKGVPASPGIAIGVIAISEGSIRKCIENKTPFILVRDVLDPKEHELIRLSQGVISVKSSVGSHGAIIANVQRKPCIVNCEHIQEINTEDGYIVASEYKIHDKTIISIDGMTGEIFLGEIDVSKPESFASLSVFESWWKKYDGTEDNLPDEIGHPHSPWGNATYTIDPNEIDVFRKQARNILRENSWSTVKSSTVELLRLFPEECTIKQVVVDAKDEDLIREILHDVIAKGYWTGPRLSMGPGHEGSSPGQIGMKTHEHVEQMMIDRDFQPVEIAPKAGYPRWMDPGPEDNWSSPPEQLIIMYDPPEKGADEFEQEHFICNITCRSNPDAVTVDILPGTARLRMFENAAPDSLIRIVALLNVNTPFQIGQIITFFGEKYWNMNRIEMVAKRMGIKQKRVSDAVPILKEMMTEGKLTSELLKFLVGNRFFYLAENVKREIFDKWWLPPIKLPFRMRALDEVYSLQVLELQGRIDNDGDLKWFLIYGAKGGEEKETIQAYKNKR